MSATKPTETGTRGQARADIQQKSAPGATKLAVPGQARVDAHTATAGDGARSGTRGQSSDDTHAVPAPGATPFDLGAIARTVLDEVDTRDPRELAALVVKRIDRRDYRAALLEALAPYMRIVNDQRRNSNPIMGGPPRSAKFDAYRTTDWDRALRDGVYVNGEWKPLGACSYEDLMAVAEDLRGKAAGLFAKADRYERIAKALAEHDVATVAELPAEAREALS